MASCKPNEIIIIISCLPSLVAAIRRWMCFAYKRASASERDYVNSLYLWILGGCLETNKTKNKADSKKKT